MEHNEGFYKRIKNAGVVYLILPGLNAKEMPSWMLIPTEDRGESRHSCSMMKASSPFLFKQE